MANPNLRRTAVMTIVPAAPMAAPSVGVKIPRNIPPMTPANSSIVSHVPPSERTFAFQEDGRRRRSEFRPATALHVDHDAEQQAVRIPGTTPAMNSLPMDSSVMIA